jgi:hypothetical protein
MVVTSLFIAAVLPGEQRIVSKNNKHRKDIGHMHLVLYLYRFIMVVISK